MAWPLNGSEAGVDLALIQTSLLSHVNPNKLASEQLDLQNKSNKVNSSLLPFKGQATEQTTVKRSIGRLSESGKSA